MREIQLTCETFIAQWGNAQNSAAAAMPFMGFPGLGGMGLPGTSNNHQQQQMAAAAAAAAAFDKNAAMNPSK